MSSPIEDASKGATKGFLEHVEEKAAELVTKFKNREIAFVKDPENVRLVKKEEETAEWKLLSQFLYKGDIALQIEMGLLLRRLDQEPQRRQSLRDNIVERFDEKGLHVAELTQVGIVGELLLHLVETGISPKETAERLDSFLLLAEDVALFVQAKDPVASLFPVIKTRLEAPGGPHMVILFGSGEICKNKVRKIVSRLSTDPRHYVTDTRERGKQLTVFVFTPDVTSKHWSELF